LESFVVLCNFEELNKALMFSTWKEM